MKEGQFNAQLVKRIRSYGSFAFKVADRFKPGIPDIYVQGGTWIESKVVKLGGQNREVNLYDKLTPEQKTFGEDLSKCGDYFIVAFRFEFPARHNRLWFIVGEVLKNRNVFSNTELRNVSRRIEKESEYPIDMLLALIGGHGDPPY